MKKLAIVFTLSVILFFGTFSSTALATVNQHANENSDRASVFIPNRYIVVLEDGFSPQEVAKGHGVAPMFVYKKALNGFAGVVSPAIVEKLKEDPRVKYVEQDKIVEITAHELGHVPPQVLPTGMDRINLDTNDVVQIDGNDDGLSAAFIAIVDTGVDLQHPDLNVHNTLGIHCSGIGEIGFCNEGAVYADDDNGHGTHVAGVAAAKDNDIGVVGSAPGATIIPVKVLDANGSGSVGGVNAGIDYVVQKAAWIDVANLSLRVPFVSQSMNSAVEAAVNAGVVMVVAAGNDVLDASTVSPASAPKAITVSALADFDGMGGGLDDHSITWNIPDTNPNVDQCTETSDDSLACFTNFGDIVDIAAPGVNILSTVPIGTKETCMFCTENGTRYASGTSSAAPHVAGAAALIRSQSPNFSMTVAEVEANLLAMAAPKNSADGYTLDANDPQNSVEPLLMLGESPPPNPIPVADAGIDQNVFEQVTVYLDGSNSYDPEGETITYSWTQTSGNSVILVNANTTSPSFTSPTVFAPTDLVFSLIVNDGLSNSLSDSVTVSVSNNVNELPTANAGINQTVNDSDGDGVQMVTLDGSGSSDPNNDIQSWEWYEGGVLLIEGEIIGYQFSVGTHDVTLKVTDSFAETSTDLVQIAVEELSTTVQITSPSYGESIEGKVTVSAYVDNLLGALNFLLIDTNLVEYSLGDADSSYQVSFHTKNYAAGDYWLTANVDDTEYDRILITIPSKGGGDGDKGGGPDCVAKPNHPKC